MDIKTLIIRFDGRLDNHEIPLFRGAVIAASGGSVLFHNHIDDNYRYSYPLIQYKKIGNNPAIVCVGLGTESIGEFFSNGDFNFMIGDRPETMEIESIRAHKTRVQLWQQDFNYRIWKWLPLNSENFQKYKAAASASEKNMLLQNILKANLLSFCKGMNIFLEDELRCTITHLSEPRIMKYKGVALMSFNVEFASNLSIPDYIGLGKNAALGFGTVTGVRHSS